MSNLFSVFEPQSSVPLFTNWISSLLVILMTPSVFWLSKNQFNKMFILSISFVKSEFLAIMGQFTSPGSIMLPVSLFIFVVLNNFFGLFPYIFTSPSHLVFTVALAFPLWVGHMVYAWILTPQNMLAHLVPMGTPYALMPFMVLIETVSNIIRPLTLSVRLAANMVAGHLLLTLLSSQAPSNSVSVMLLVISSLILLSVLETAVALIQAYVFSVLSTLYLSEVESLNLSN